jgi:DNA topoisomerase VI subunit B
MMMRTAFVTDRATEFLTESELTTQIGYGRKLWLLVLAKELIDNALDACESAAPRQRFPRCRLQQLRNELPVPV